ncbi:hypothetical protein V2J09_001486 [Rumex salicifolius]
MASQLRTSSFKKEYKLHQIVWHAILSTKTISTSYFNAQKQHRQSSQLIKKTCRYIQTNVHKFHNTRDFIDNIKVP